MSIAHESTTGLPTENLCVTDSIELNEIRYARDPRTEAGTGRHAGVDWIGGVEIIGELFAQRPVRKDRAIPRLTGRWCDAAYRYRYAANADYARILDCCHYLAITINADIRRRNAGTGDIGGVGRRGRENRHNCE
jgi:hypothetical protein